MKPWAIAGLIIIILLLLLFGSALNRQIAPGEARRLAKTNVIEIKPTLAEITNGTFAFFDSHGNPLVGFVEEGTNISLFPQPTGTSPSGATISQITKEKVERYTVILREKTAEDQRLADAKVAAERRAAEENDAKQKERALIAQIQKEKEEQEARRVQQSNDAIRAQAELREYRNHYLTLTAHFDRAVFIVDEAKNQNLVLSSLIAESFAATGAKATSGFFKPAFVKDGLFDNVFTGQTDAANRLQVTNIHESILLGRQTVEYASSPSLKDVVTANMTLELSATSASDLRRITGQTLRSTAPGFSRDEARRVAEENIISQLTNGILEKLNKSLSPK